MFGNPLHQSSQIVYAEPFDKTRSLVLFRTNQHQELSVTLLEKVGRGGWRMTGPVGLDDRRSSLGPLPYGRGNVGEVQEKIGDGTFIHAEKAVVFGEVLDRQIDWVELTLYEDGAQPIRAKVQDGIWMVTLPGANQLTWFDIRAGKQNGFRYWVLTEQAAYEVACSSRQVPNPLLWTDLQPICERVLPTIRLGL